MPEEEVNNQEAGQESGEAERVMQRAGDLCEQAATMFASSCQALLAQMDADNRSAIARAIVIVVGADGKFSASYSLDNPGADIEEMNEVDGAAEVIRDVLAMKAASQYVGSMEQKIKRTLNSI